MPRPKPDIESKTLVDRRAMLVASAALATPLAVPAIADTSDAPQQTNGSCEYRDTEHIRQYYAKCRF